MGVIDSSRPEAADRAQAGAAQASASLLGLDAVRFRLAALVLRVTALGAEIRDFAEWFEAWLERGGGLVTLVRLLNQRLFELTPDQSFAAVAAGLYDPEAGAFS